MKHFLAQKWMTAYLTSSKIIFYLSLFFCVLFYFSWLFDRHVLFIELGIGAAIALFFAGGSRCLIFSLHLWFGDDVEQENNAALHAISQLIGSFFLVALALFFAEKMMTRIEVTIDNQSSLSVENLDLYDGKSAASYGDIASGSRKALHFYPKAKGPLRAKFLFSGKQLDVTAVAYMSTEGNSDMLVCISARGEITTHSAHSPQQNHCPEASDW